MQPRAKITREAILEASAILFSKTGYAGTTIDDIVTLAPVTKGAMYFHFSKKESIAREMLRRWSDAVTTTVGKAIATGQPADRQVLMIYRELARRTQNEPIIPRRPHPVRRQVAQRRPSHLRSVDRCDRTDRRRRESFPRPRLRPVALCRYSLRRFRRRCAGCRQPRREPHHQQAGR